ncbi:MAG: hypothetical protein CM1200mP41_09170 [Gammaproteobacteria bacterium]|nr:MAG: hypothetical protein CM1200mP41_09170 [Gammaproteobacteria bacterium]
MNVRGWLNELSTGRLSNIGASFSGTVKQISVTYDTALAAFEAHSPLLHCLLSRLSYPNIVNLFRGRKETMTFDRIAAAIPPLYRSSLQRMCEKCARSAVFGAREDGFGYAEEMEVQEKVLLRTREKLESLLIRLDQLERELHENQRGTSLSPSLSLWTGSIRQGEVIVSLAVVYSRASLGTSAPLVP